MEKEKMTPDISQEELNGQVVDQNNDAAVSAEELNKIMSKYDREASVRVLPRYLNWFIVAVLIGFSLLQLYSTWRIIPSTHMRPLHVGIVTFLAFALYPVRKGGFKSKKGWWISFAIDAVLAIVALYVFLYPVVNYNTLVHTARYTTMQYVIGGIAVVLLLEACRRVSGLPIVCVALFFMLVGIFGQAMPGFLANRGFTLQRIIKHLFFGQEGIFGTPIGASSTFIFLFILFGSFLDKTGVGQFFIDFGNAVAGSRRGGPAKVAVLTSALQGTVSGSSVANTVATGSFTIPMMKRLGYRPEFAAATEAAASTGGQIMPPVMGAAAFLMVDALEVPYSVIVKAAIIPALLYFIGIWFAVDFEARKHGLMGLPKDQLPKMKRLMLERGYLILPLVAIVTTLSTGFTSSMAALIGIGTAILGSYLRTAAEICTIVVCKRTPPWISKSFVEGTVADTKGQAIRASLHASTGLRPKDYLKALENGARSIIGVALACGVAGIISGMITLTGIGTKLSATLSTIAGDSTFLLLFFTMLASIVLGMGVPTTANYLITSTMMAGTVAAMLNPGVTVLGWQQKLPAHMFTFYFGIIADITPPVALAAMAGSAIAKSNPLKTGWQASKNAIAAFIVPYIFILNPQMLMINASFLEVAQITITSLIGMYMVSMGVVGYFKMKLNILQRLMAVGFGLCLIIPGWLTDLIGLAGCALVIFWHMMVYRAKNKKVA